MKIFLLLSLVCIQFLANAQVDTLGTEVQRPKSFAEMKKSANTLKIAGGACAGVGLTLMMIGGSKQMAEIAGAFVLQEPDMSQGSTEVTIGTIMFLGGIGLYIAGGVKSSKAKKMRAAGEISFYPSVPPAFVAPKVSIPQAGITFKRPLFPGK